MNIDIKFIARKAGVSPATVSRVINQTKPVSEELRQRVMAQVEQYGYRPNFMARSLIRGKSSLIGVIAPNVSDIFHAKIISSIEQRANQFGHNVIVSNIYTDFDKQRRSFEIMRERRVDGIILLHENSPEQMEAVQHLIQVPLVLASVNVPGSALPAVGIDDELAAYDAVSYLIRLGHRRIAGVFAEGYTLDVLRRNGYLRALEDQGVPVREEYLYSTTYGMEQGEEAMEHLFRCKEPPTAVFCISDELAIGGLNYLLDRGYRLPDDVSIFGFDDINLASAVRPKLSTIRQPIEEIGRQAAEMLVTMIDAKPLAERRTIFPHRLIIRDSCCPPKEE